MINEATQRFLSSYDSTRIEDFLILAFPPQWAGAAARILETGVTIANGECKWAPRWTQIPMTKKVREDELTAKIASIIFRAHDAIHQLWGLPHPTDMNDVGQFYTYKRVQICGEIAVLTLVEFVYCKWVHDTFPDLRAIIAERGAIPMMAEAMSHCRPTEIAARLDGVLHKHKVPKWVRDSDVASRWVAHYTPMIEFDREMVDACWQVMRDDPSIIEGLRGAPCSQAPEHLDGLELTLWMVSDFERATMTTPVVDWALVEFNRARRSGIVLPAAWPV